MKLRTASVVCAAATLIAGATSVSALQTGPAHGAPRSDNPLVQTFANVSRSTAWTRTATLDLDFETYHPQAMEVIGDRIYLSSVEIIEPTVRFPEPVDGYDRTPGKGIGHLFVLDRDGQLLKDIEISDGHRYHPGGLDYDGESLWLPVAEYRPNSSADIYRIDPTTYDVTKQFTVSDHIGGVVRDQETRHLVGQSWGSRRFYDWTESGKQKDFWLNANHFLDYQDCEYVGSRKALCSGVTGLPAQPGATTGYELGGLAMIDLRDRHRILHEVPLQHWSTAGHAITRNPTDLDVDGSHLTLYAAPDDSDEAAGTQILVYEADVAPLS
ncbi:MAG: DUF6454 family protein [Nocardioidaceae bacterium]